ncbi:hypothetical protein [Bacillus haynesii]|uniref:hypothetical protein n=1 Tax=Bacillus haynesii TaxID=1925021 RepID=UPI0022825953|nr:hypothetical protein [Bacillus haynesii]MCY8754806.1 hypothetical protein [Bacillus haynesii]
MTKTNEKIHVLADESLGGINREYVEVDRNADVGDRVIADGTYREVVAISSRCGVCLDGDESIGIPHSYRVLEPTNIVHIDGERYEMVDRKPEKGEKVICLDDTGGDLTIGGMYTIDEIIEEDGMGYGFIDDVGEERAFWDEAKYRVLVPAESSEEEPQPSDPIDVIANLATRVAELERENKRIKEDLGWNEMGPGRIAELRNADSDIRHDIATLEERVDNDYEEVDAWADSVNEKMSRLQDEIDTLHKDNRRHGEEIAQLDKGVHTQSQRHLYRQQEIERVWERMDRIESEMEALKYAAKETDGKMAHLEADSDMRMFTAEEVAALLNAMRERQ